MEIKTYNSESHVPYTSQLETIKYIENNLTLLKSRMNFFQKYYQRKNKSIEKIFTSSIPLIKGKISYTENHIKAKKSMERFYQTHVEKVSYIKASRLKNETEISRNKTSLHLSKIQESSELRSLSKKNDELIQQAKQDFIAKNRKKRYLVKSLQYRSRQRISYFHLQKHQYLKNIKEEYRKYREKIIRKLNKQFYFMCQMAEMYQKRVSQQGQIYARLKKVISCLEFIRPYTFENIVKELSINEETPIDDELAYKILMEVEKRKGGAYNYEQYNKKLDENGNKNESKVESKVGSKRDVDTTSETSKKTLPRIRSEPLALKSIYGAPWPLKK